VASSPSGPPAPPAPEPIALRGDEPAPLRFRQGAHAPYAIRWFGSSALFGHLRHFVASAVASESVDSRDWMRAQGSRKVLRKIVRVLGGDEAAPTLVEAMGRPVWLDFVADTGDDRDLSVAVARMIFADYMHHGQTLPRGDLLVFGGDTAYPVSTADEIYKRLTQPWNEVLRATGTGGRRRVLLGIPGNHDWYDGLDGFARLFRRSATPVTVEDLAGTGRLRRAKSPERGRSAGLVAKQLHLDEVGASLGLAASAWRSVRAFFKGDRVKRRKRLGFTGYESVQESSYWAFPLAPGLDVWGTDRQLRRVDFRQRLFFVKRREEAPSARILFCTADPAVAFGEASEKGMNVLSACGLKLGRDPVYYLAGDVHHYERREIGPSIHVIAGGGGAFLHGTRVAPPRPTLEIGASKVAYPTGAMSRRIVLAAPLKMMLGQAGFLPHMAWGLVAFLETSARGQSEVASIGIATFFTVVMAVSFYMNAGHHRPHPRLVSAVAIPFAVVLGALPMLLQSALPRMIPQLAGVGAVVLVYAFLASFGFGLFLTTCCVLGIEHEQAFAALGHPGFKHFVRLCIHPDGKIECWAIGKDDPLSPGSPVVVDHFGW